MRVVIVASPKVVFVARRALVLQHVLFEDLGLLAPLLRQHGYEVAIRELGVDEPAPRSADADLLVVLGGPIGVADVGGYPGLIQERRLIEEALERGTPVLGICLGAQLIAAALGTRVTATGRAEIGYGPLSLTAEGERGVLAPLADLPVLHWHGDEFDIPAGAARLAETPGWPNQAFSVGTDVLGLQFHIEADPSRIERWLVGHAHELAIRGIDPRGIRADAREHGPDLARRGTTVLDRWLTGLPAIRGEA